MHSIVDEQVIPDLHMIVDKCSDEWNGLVPLRIPKTSGVVARSDGLVPIRIPKASKVSSTSVTARANTSSAVDEAREAKKLDNIKRAEQINRRLSAWKKWKHSEWGPQARAGPTRATLTAIAAQTMKTPNEVAKRLGEGEVVRI